MRFRRNLGHAGRDMLARVETIVTTAPGAKRLGAGTAAVIHLGGVRFPVTGPLRYTMDANEAVEACRLIDPRTAVPLHYEGWKHFRQPAEQAQRIFASSPIGPRVRRTARHAPPELTGPRRMRDYIAEIEEGLLRD